MTLSSATVVLEVGPMVASLLVIVETATSVVDMEVIAMVFLLVTTGIVVALAAVSVLPRLLLVLLSELFV